MPQNCMETNYKFLSVGVCDADRVPVGPKLQWDKESLAYACLSGQVHMRLKSAAHYSGIMEHLLRTQYQVKLAVVPYGGAVQHRSDMDVKYMRLSQRKQKKVEKLIHDNVKYPASATVDMLRTEEEYTACKLQAVSFRKAGAEPVVRQKLYVWRMVHELYQVSDSLCDQELFESYVSSFVESESSDMVHQFYALQRLHHAVHRESSVVFDNYLSKQESIRGEQESAIALYNSKAHSYYQPAVAVSKLLDLLDSGWRAKMLQRAAIMVPIEQFVPAVKSWLGSMTDEVLKSLQAVLQIEPDEEVSRTGILAKLDEQSKPSATASNIARDFMKSGFGISLGALASRNTKAFPQGRKPLQYNLYSAIVDKYKAGSFNPPVEGYVLSVYAFDDDEPHAPLEKDPMGID